jgi:hypothetical protein
VGVGAGVGLGDGEGHLPPRVVDAADLGEPFLALLVGAVVGDDRAADGGRDDHEEQRAAVGGQLLDDEGQLVHPHAAPAVLLGQVDAHEAGLGHRFPELVGPATGLRLLPVVVMPEPGGELADGLAQHLVFGRLVEVHQVPP